LSHPRFNTYLAASGGAHQQALELYEWNASISAAFMHDLAHLEVGIRNAYDRALNTRPAATAPWVHDPAVFGPLLRTKKRWDPAARTRRNVRVDINEKPRKALGRAVAEAGGTGAPPGKVIAQLSFGFWRYLSSSAHDATLWRTCLFRAFPAGTARTAVDTRMGDLHELRNRVAHHEPLMALSLASSAANIRDLALMIDPNFHGHLVATTDVPRLLAGRPGQP
jgi:hypothetical protein